jgi:ribosomal protein S11
MTERTKNHLTLAGVVAGATLVATSLGGAVNWAVDMNRKLDHAESVRDSTAYANTLLAERVARLEQAVGIKKGKLVLRQPERRGVARRLLGLFW